MFIRNKINFLNSKILIKSFVFLALYFSAFLFASFCLGRVVSVDFITWIFIFTASVLVQLIKSNSYRYMSYFWFLWPVIGICNIGSWVYLFSSEHIDIEGSIFVYQVFLIAFLIPGLKTISGYKKINSDPQSVNLMWYWLILSYPFLMGLQSIINVGSIPLFSGEGFVDEMYSINYGFLYTYKFIMLVSMAIMFWKALNSSGLFKAFWVILLSISMVIALFDGKRVIVLAFFLVACVLYFKHRNVNSVHKVFLYLIPSVFIYVFIGQLRSGEISPAFNEILVGIFYTAGVEYRDFALTFTNVKPGEIEGYNWFLSSLAALVNSNIANLIGFDKDYYISIDSARAFMRLYDINFGIRTGIISELWFDYGWFGLVVAFILGIGCRFLCNKVDYEQNLLGCIYLSIIYGFSVLAIMGQSSMFFGMLLTLFYIYAAHYFLSVIFPKLKVNL